MPCPREMRVQMSTRDVAWAQIVGSALTDIAAVNQNRVPEIPNGVLYHYTSVEGLEGIVRSNQLWATAASHLNDSSEIEYGSELVRRVLREWFRNRRADNSLAERIWSSVLNIFQNPVSRFARNSTVYVSCFCEKDNLLSQWRAYGQRGGYSLQFLAADGAFPRVRPVHNFYSSRLVKVTYDSDRQLGILNELILALNTSLNTPDVTQGFSQYAADDQHNTIQVWLLAIHELILEEIAAFKNPAFSVEEEWRLVVRPRIFPPQTNEDRAPAGGTLHCFRASRGIIVPYVLLAPSDGKLPITQIRLGPSIERERVQNSLTLFLATNGFQNVHVDGSDIPVIL
jgi:hypothetical protein